MEAEHRKELLSSNIQSAEDERLRIARDVHDELGGIFSTLSLSLQQLNPETEKNKDTLQQSKHLIQTGINSVRRISHAIIPFELELLGLDQTLSNYTQSVSTASGIDIHFEFDHVPEEMNPTVSLATYRIIQELLNNTLKYAGASSVEISCCNYEGHLQLRYKDNGVGVDLTDKKIKRGIGIKNIESRVLALDGNVYFTSSPGQGFNCELSLPFNQTSEL
ncbi:sensor histidine kinase [Fluviicola chungangensis]|uniref:histidine kinase n=1 Tax=Fluviicola chungangensis TaxID=2597671 RepID=A0A556MQ82_9FLAO|nr:sensor histidine kinase [Fluviicola chungangensis]TSJ42104.1 sensor histidine kinase [Fluviicola chungangensis]